MVKYSFLPCILGCWVLFSVAFSQPKIELIPFATGLELPVDIAHAGDHRLFVVGKRGTIHIVDTTGAVNSTPFLDIRDRVNSASSERGLLGLAFHPEYGSNGYFFVNYTGSRGETHIARFEVQSNDPNQADPTTEKTILTVDQPYVNHNAGDLNFGPDGYLYIALGDGGDGGDPLNKSQTPTELLGKILRIDIDQGDPYSIPPDNPFVNDDFYQDEIWAIGLRNPWRFSFDRETFDMWIGDVGQSAWEEIDFMPFDQQGGENYGWRCYEGNKTFNTSGCQNASNYVFPVFEYRNNRFEDGCSVTGGFVYRGKNFPTLYGHYVFADYCSGKIWTIAPDSLNGWKVIDQGKFSPGDISTFGEDKEGELYVASIGSGIISRVQETCAAEIPQVVQLPNSHVLQASGEGTFQWYRDGNLLSQCSGNECEATENGAYTVTLTTASGCTVRSAVFTFILSSRLDEAAFARTVRMTPHPFSRETLLSFYNPEKQPYDLLIHDIQGRKVREVPGITAESYRIPRGNLPPGVYIIELQGEFHFVGRMQVLDE